jgi:hypothetical protein
MSVHHAVFAQLLGREIPPWLEVALMNLQALGVEATEPLSLEDRFPLFTSLGTDEVGQIGLLHWPTPQPGVGVPVVRVRGQRLELVAPTVQSWLLHRVATIDVEGELSDALREAVAPMYEVGEVACTGLPLVAWVVLKGGGAPWAYRSLLERHLAKGDLGAAKVTADRASERAPGWAEFHTWRMRALGRGGDALQARDAAVGAMGLPVWTHLSDFASIAKQAGWNEPIDATPYRRLSVDVERPPADRAAHLMDVAVIDGVGWDNIRAELSNHYRDAGLDGVARLVAG